MNITMIIAHIAARNLLTKGRKMKSNIIKGNLYIPEQKKVPPMPKEIMKAQDFQFTPFIELELQHKLMVYRAEAKRLRSDTPKDCNGNVIDAYNKGMLYKLESIIDDLSSLIK